MAVEITGTVPEDYVPSSSTAVQVEPGVWYDPGIAARQAERQAEIDAIYAEAEREAITHLQMLPATVEGRDEALAIAMAESYPEGLISQGTQSQIDEVMNIASGGGAVIAPAVAGTVTGGIVPTQGEAGELYTQEEITRLLDRLETETERTIGTGGSAATGGGFLGSAIRRMVASITRSRSGTLTYSWAGQMVPSIENAWSYMGSRHGVRTWGRSPGQFD